MFYIQHTTSVENILILKNLVNGTDNSEMIRATADAFNKINTSNQNFFNIVLAIFAAWVGAVVAFYFGSENLQQAQQTLQDVLTGKQKLAKETIEELLSDLPEAKDVTIVKIDDTVENVRKKLQNISNVLVVNTKDKPMGVLYRWDLAKQAEVNIYEPEKEDNKEILSEIIDKIKDEFITKKSWDKDDGIPNFASLSLKDNLLQAKEKMEELARSRNDLLSVRGIVLDKESKIVGIVNFANLTEGII